MAWESHGVDNNSLVSALKRSGILTSPRAEAAMRAVDRGLFTAPGTSRSAAYMDCPQPIGSGATISAPHMHAHCLDILEHHLTPGARVLDVGSGSGYLTAVMARMVCTDDGRGSAVGVDHISDLVERSKASVSHIPWAKALMDRGQLVLVQGDGRMGVEGDASTPAQFEAIHVGAAAPQIPPDLVAQLAPGGRMLIPVGPEGGPQQLVVVDKDAAGGVTSRAAMGVIYVPLTSQAHQMGRA